MIPTIIEATSLADAWFQAAWQLMRGQTGVNTYMIDRGSYVGQHRLEFDFMLLTVKNPGVRPLIPEIPPHLNIPPPVESMEYVEHYFAEYLMDPELKKNETYKYATWLAPGVERVIEQLRGAPGNNQAAVSIGGFAPYRHDTERRLVDRPDATYVNAYLCYDTDNFIDPGTGERDPACLRVVDFRLDQQNTLHMFVYFRCLAEELPIFFRDRAGVRLGTAKDVYLSCKKGNYPDVVGVDLCTGAHHFAAVTKASRRRADDIFSIKTKNGAKISVTPEHHVFVLRDKNLILKQARELEVGDRLVCGSVLPQWETDNTLPVAAALTSSKRNYYLRGVPLKIHRELRRKGIAVKSTWCDKRILPFHFFSAVEVVCKEFGIDYIAKVGAPASKYTWEVDQLATPGLGYLIGAWLANGTLRKNAIRISSGQEKVIAKLNRVLKELNVNFTTYKQSGCLVFNIADVFIRDVLHFWGLSGHARTKFVPEGAFKFSPEIRNAIFQGWWEGDAGCTVSEQLAIGMQYLALSTGITCSIYVNPPRIATFPDGRKVMSSICYRLYPISGERHMHTPPSFKRYANRLIVSRVTEISLIAQTGWVVDFTVEGTENLLVGNRGILVHNSWDCWSGLPANLAGLQLLKEYVAQELGAEDGRIVAASKGCHIYSHAIQVAAERCNMTKVGTLDDLAKWHEEQNNG